MVMWKLFQFIAAEPTICPPSASAAAPLYLFCVIAAQFGYNSQSDR